MKKTAIGVIAMAIICGVGCGEPTQEESPKMIEVNTENLSEEAKVAAENIEKEMNEKVAQLEDEAKSANEDIAKRTQELKDALEAMDEEFKTNE
ncbi:hypothetical protein N9R81_05445 [Flavobacteriales bacterium]|nr:hypothetical protein [Flavobacteriales bacterium]